MIPVLCGAVTDRWVAALNQHCPSPEYTSEPIQNARVAVFTAGQAGQLNTLEHLEWAHCTYAGVEKALALTQLPIARLIDPRLSQRMAQSCLSACLNYCQNSARYHIQQRHQHWKPWDQKAPERTQVLMLGAGVLATHCATVLSQAGFKVATYSRRAKAMPWPHFSKLGPEVIEGAHIVINLLPATPDTYHWIDDSFLQSFQQDKLLVNFGRGSAVDDQALLSWLNTDPSHFALLDVFKTEPLPEESELWGHPQVQIWPHVSASTDIQSAAAIIHQAIQRYLTEGVTPALVDRDRGY